MVRDQVPVLRFGQGGGLRPSLVPGQALGVIKNIFYVGFLPNNRGEFGGTAALDEGTEEVRPAPIAWTCATSPIITNFAPTRSASASKPLATRTP